MTEGNDQDSRFFFVREQPQPWENSPDVTVVSTRTNLPRRFRGTTGRKEDEALGHSNKPDKFQRRWISAGGGGGKGPKTSFGF